jgi:hypothetical protein
MLQGQGLTQCCSKVSPINLETIWQLSDDTYVGMVRVDFYSELGGSSPIIYLNCISYWDLLSVEWGPALAYRESGPMDSNYMS